MFFNFKLCSLLIFNYSLSFILIFIHVYTTLNDFNASSILISSVHKKKLLHRVHLINWDKNILKYKAKLNF